MDRKKHFGRYYSRFMWEGIINSLLLGLVVGCGLGFATALAMWFMVFDLFWLPIVITAGGIIIATVLFYFFKFRPTVASNAKRIDRYGLEERLITMVELEGDDSYLAKLQREDAAEKLSKLSAKQIRFCIPKLYIILASVIAFLGIGMNVVNALAEKGVLPHGYEVVDDIIPDPDPVYVTVTYIVSEGGIIEGDESQVIELGGQTTAVIAVPDDGYAFYCWDDGGKRPTRTDYNVTEDVIYEAVFLPLDENGEGQPGDEGQPSDQGDQPGDQPGDKEGEGEGDKTRPNAPPSGGAGGQFLPSNQVIDGDTYYGSVFDQYYDQTISDLTEDSQMSSDLKDFINNYNQIIQAKDPEAEENEG